MKYKYRGVNDIGKITNGEVEAADARVAAAMVKELKLTPIKIEPKNSMLDFKDIMGKLGGVSNLEVTNFTRQLSTMITAGLPITDALNLLKLQSSAKFSVVVSAIMQDVQGGVSLSESLARHPEVFSKVYVASVKAGEAAGIMDTILNRLANTMEKSREFQAKVKGAMIYPIIVLLGMVAVMVVMIIYVVPKLEELYADFDCP
jgi:type IV pilus assembly protein PilC